MTNRSNSIQIGLLGIFLLGLNLSWAAKPEKLPDSAKVAQMESWKRSPHNFLVGCGTLLAPEAHKIYTWMALSTSLTYQYDIPWQHKRTNFFVMTGIGYEGCYRNDKPYRAKSNIVYENYVYDNVHLYVGAGIKVRMASFLDLSFSASIDGSFSSDFGRYPSTYESENPGVPPYDRWVGRVPTERAGIRGLFSIALTYEIKNFRLFAGCQAYVSYLNDLDELYFGPKKPKAMPFNSWATFGVGYRF